MTLLAATKLRINAELLTDLTNQAKRGTGLSEVDDIINAAIADAQEEFLDETSLTFDETNAGHIRVGVQGVLCYLHIYANKNTEKVNRLETRWRQMLTQISRTRGGERRILPSTTTTSTPSEPEPGRLPEQDPVRWSNYVLDPPIGLDRNDDLIRDN